MRKTDMLKGTVLALLAAASLTACGGMGSLFEEEVIVGAPGFEELEPVMLIGADAIAKGAAGQEFFEDVAENVDRITGGKLRLDLFHNGELGNDEEIFRQMRFNDIHVTVSQTAPAVPFIPDLAALDLPMVFAKYDADTIDTVLNSETSEFHRRLSESYEKAGLHLLGILQNSTYRLTTANRDLGRLEDFKGLQIRTMGNSNHMAFWTAIGAEPTPLPWSEVYFALQSGTVDAQENAADTIRGANLYEIQKVLACTNHILYANQICITKKAYEELDPKYQAALNQAVEEALADMRPALLRVDEENRNALESEGMRVITYGNEFYDEVLALDSVQGLYRDIDASVNGLGTVLKECLEKEAEEKEAKEKEAKEKEAEEKEAEKKESEEMKAEEIKTDGIERQKP